jgi:hypothetical protein
MTKAIVMFPGGIMEFWAFIVFNYMASRPLVYKEIPSSFTSYPSLLANSLLSLQSNG